MKYKLIINNEAIYLERIRWKYRSGLVRGEDKIVKAIMTPKEFIRRRNSTNNGYYVLEYNGIWHENIIINSYEDPSYIIIQVDPGGSNETK